MRLVRRLYLCVLALALVAPAPALAQDPASIAIRKIDRSLRESMRHGGKTRRVIVTVKPGYRGEIRQALESHGDVINGESALVDALAVEVHREDVAELAKHPWVELVSEDAVVRVTAASSATARKQAGRAKSTRGAKSRSRNEVDVVKSTAADDGAVSLSTSTMRRTPGLPTVPTLTTPSGAGIGVAIIDSGIAPSADFGRRIAAFYDFTKGGAAAAPSDEYGHGTHVAGLIGSSGVRSNYAMIGVAPQVRFVGLKVLDKNGEGLTSNVIKALEFVTANRARLGVHVVNLSLGHPIYAPAKDDPLVRAVEKAADTGLVVVVAAGNFGQNPQSGEEGYTGITSPANAPSAITVGAASTGNTVTRLDDVVARFSSRGPTWFDGFAKPDVIAPGHQLASDTSTSSYLYGQLKENRKKASNGSRFLQLSGTSMAAAVTSGVVAVVLDANTRANYYNATPLTPNAVKAILEFTAIPVKDADVLSQGAGSLNALGANGDDNLVWGTAALGWGRIF